MKDILTSPRIQIMKRKRRARRIRLTILLFILFICAGYAVGYFSSSPRVTIQNVVVTGTNIIRPEDVVTRVQANLAGKYLRLFSRSNSFLYPKVFIYSDLMQSFPRIDKLSIYRDNLQTLHVAIGERSGSSLYCGDSVPLSPADVGENCYFINNDGYIFDKAPYFSGNVYFKYYIPLDHPGDPQGTQALPPERFHAVVRFMDSITNLGFKPIYVVVNASGEYHLYLNPLSNTGTPEIIFKGSNDLDKILDNLALALTKPEFANEIKEKYATLQYIDLRFDNKVLYKFQ